MLSINRLSARQLTVRKGRTILTGTAISLGVASILSLLLLTMSGSAAMGRSIAGDDSLAQNPLATSIYIMFGAISLVVGAVLVYITFAVTAAEREREFGLLKTLGATRQRLRQLVYREATLLGLVFSLLGIILGLVMSFLYMKIGILTGMFQGIKLSDVPIKPQAIIIAFIAGISMTFFSALLPARRAGKIPPLASIRPLPGSEQKVSRVRWVGLVLFIIGAVLFFEGFRGKDLSAGYTMSSVGVLAIYIGTAVFLPVAIVSLFRIFDMPLFRRIGIAGRLAAKNLARQSLRNAQVIVIILVTVSLVADTAIMYFTFNTGFQRIKKQVKWDMSISSADARIPTAISKGLVDRIRGLQEVKMATTVKSGMVKVAHESLRSADRSKLKGAVFMLSGELAGGLESPAVYAIDPAQYQQLSSLFLPAGSDARQIWNKLQGNYILANQAWAKALHLKPGDTVKLIGKNGEHVTFTLLSYVDSFLTGETSARGCIYMSQQNAERYFNINEDSNVLIKLKNGYNKTKALGKIKRLTVGTQLEVLTNAQISKRVDQLLESGPLSPVFAFVILGMAILVSLLSVFNTVAINVLHRRPEIGLIKAIGGTARQVRSSIILETILLSLTGSILGIIWGAGISNLECKSMFSNTLLPFRFTVPVSQLALMLMLIAVVSTVGTLVPIRLANKITPIEALRIE